MSFNDLPNELVLEIGFFISTAGDFKRFASTNSGVFALLRPVLFSRFAQDPGNFVIALHLSAISGSKENLRILLGIQRHLLVGRSRCLVEAPSTVDEAIDLLIEHCHHYVVVDEVYGRSPLFWAMVELRVGLFLKFLAMGTALDVPDHKGRTPLYWTVTKGWLASCQALLNAGASVHEKSLESQYTPLHAAVFYYYSHSFEFIQLLLKCSPHIVNDRSGRGLTPLTLAIQCRNREAARILLENGADPYSFSTDPGDLDLIFQYGTGAPMRFGVLACKSSSLRCAIVRRELRILGLILAGQVDRLDAIGATPLQYAASDHNPAVVIFLLKMGADVNYMGNRGYTALHQASSEGCTLTVLALLYGRANINARCLAHGRTALHWAVIAGISSGLTIDYLLKAGIDTDAMDMYGKSAIDYAHAERNWGAFMKLDLHKASRGARGYWYGCS